MVLDPIRVLLVMPTLGSGGVPHQVLYLLKSLKREKFSFKVVAFQKKSFYLNQWPAEVPLICLNKESRFDFFRLVWQLRSLIREEKPDTILSFCWYANFLALLCTRAMRHRPSVIIVAPCSTSYFLRASRFAAVKSLLIRWFYPRASHIIAVSRGVKDDLVQSFSMRPSKIKVIYCGIDTEQIRALNREWVSFPWFKERLPIIIAVGRLAKEKNYPLLLKAFSLARRKIPSRLIVLGEGEKQEFLEELVKEWEIEKDVSFVGFQENPFKWMARASMLALSSNFEGFANVIIEAMACGTPVVSTRCPCGPDEVIDNGIDGLLVECGDEKALAGAMLRLLKNEDLRRELIRNAKNKVEQFSLSRMTNEYDQVLRWGNKET